MPTPIVTNFSEDPEQIVIDLINNDNVTAFTEAMLTFGLPTQTTGDSPARNTTVTITAVAGSGYSGSQTVQYNRVDISTVPGSRSTVFPIGSAVNISDLIPAINAAYGINLTSADFVDGPLPTFTGTPNEEHDFTLTMNSDSLVWINAVTLTVQANDIPLTTAVTSTVLNGLTYIQPSS